jgi:hypothetical protein
MENDSSYGTNSTRGTCWDGVGEAWDIINGGTSGVRGCLIKVRELEKGS